MSSLSLRIDSKTGEEKEMKIPRTRHQKVKQLKPWLSVYQDKRSTNESKFEGSSGGAGYEYWGTTHEQSSIQKECNKLLRMLARKSRPTENKRSSTGTSNSA